MLLQLDAIRKLAGNRVIIEKASLSADQGEILCIAGPSGIGKTTLLEIIAGIVAPDAGTVRQHATVALAFQDDVLLPWLTAHQNILYALSSKPDQANEPIVQRWLDIFELSPALLPGQMSGGMRRRLNLARTFAVDRKIIVLDEPYAFLDHYWQERVTESIRSAAASGAAVIMASHQLKPLEGCPCRIIILEGSPILLSDTTRTAMKCS